MAYKKTILVFVMSMYIFSFFTFVRPSFVLAKESEDLDAFDSDISTRWTVQIAGMTDPPVVKNGYLYLFDNSTALTNDYLRIQRNLRQTDGEISLLFSVSAQQAYEIPALYPSGIFQFGLYNGDPNSWYQYTASGIGVRVMSFSNSSGNYVGFWLYWNNGTYHPGSDFSNVTTEGALFIGSANYTTLGGWSELFLAKFSYDIDKSDFSVKISFANGTDIGERSFLEFQDVEKKPLIQVPPIFQVTWNHGWSVAASVAIDYIAAPYAKYSWGTVSEDTVPSEMDAQPSYEGFGIAKETSYSEFSYNYSYQMIQEKIDNVKGTLESYTRVSSDGYPSKTGAVQYYPQNSFILWVQEKTTGNWYALLRVETGARAMDSFGVWDEYGYVSLYYDGYTANHEIDSRSPVGAAIGTSGPFTGEVKVNAKIDVSIDEKGILFFSIDTVLSFKWSNTYNPFDTPSWTGTEEFKNQYKGKIDVSSYSRTYKITTWHYADFHGARQTGYQLYADEFSNLKNFQVQSHDILAFLAPVGQKVVGGILEPLIQFFGGIILFLINAIASLLFYIIGLVMSVVLGLKSFLGSLLQSILNQLAQLPDAVYNLFDSILNNILTSIQAIANDVWSLFQSILNNILSELQGLASSIWNQFASYITDIWTWLSTIVNDIWNWMINNISSIWSSISGILNTIFTDIFNALISLVDLVIDFLGKAAEYVLQTVLGINITDVQRTIDFGLDIFDLIFQVIGDAITLLTTLINISVKYGLWMVIFVWIYVAVLPLISAETIDEYFKELFDRLTIDLTKGATILGVRIPIPLGLPLIALTFITILGWI